MSPIKERLLFFGSKPELMFAKLVLEVDCSTLRIFEHNPDLVAGRWSAKLVDTRDGRVLCETKSPKHQFTENALDELWGLFQR